MSRAILLTGATGLIGSELLRRLAPRRELVVLLRARGDRAYAERGAELSRELFGSRPPAGLRFVEAELDAPRLGMSEAGFAALAASIEEIAHLAADVRFDLPLEEARRSNVVPVERLLELAELSARAGGFRRFHHVSTFAVARPGRERDTLIRERPSPRGAVYRNNYERTKAEAERLLLSRAKTVPVSIYRTSIVCGDSRTGWTPKFDTFYPAIRFFTSSAAEGIDEIPLRRGALLDAVTVDFVADALAALTARTALPASGEILHLTAGPEASPLARSIREGAEVLAAILRARGERVPRIPRIVEIESLSESGASDELGDLGGLERLFPYALEGRVYDNSKALAALEGTGVRPLPMHQHLPALLDYCVRTDWGSRPDPEPIAIVGLGGVFPGANGIPAFWRNLREGRDEIADAPRERWDAAVFHAEDPDAEDRSCSRRGGFVRDLPFDERKFRVPPVTARAMDRMQKMVLLAASEALEGARIADRTRAGMYLGCGDAYLENDLSFGCRPAWNLFKPALDEALAEEGLGAEERERIRAELEPGVIGEVPPMSEDTLPGSLANVAAGRVMNFFDLKGPSLAIGAGFGSALAAVEQAVDALRAGDCDWALAGGAHGTLDPLLYIGLSKEGILSPERARPFDRRADGTTPGEGAGLFLLKRVSDALRDGDPVHAVILGVGRASAGREHAVTTPSPEAFELAAREALVASGVGAASIGFVESHGSGVPEEDRAELAALSRIYARGTRLGAHKDTIGNLVGAAAAAGMMKAVLTLRERRFVPERAGESPVEGLDAFSLTRAEEAWPSAEAPRRAAVCGFGNWGQAFHAVLEEWDPARFERWRGPARRSAPEPIAIVGLGAVLPGASDANELWRNLLAGKRSIGELPQALWEGRLEAFYDPDEEARDKTYGKLGAFAPPAVLDAASFQIPPAVARRMDPNQLRFIEAARQALDDFGWSRRGGELRSRAALAVGESSSGLGTAWQLVRRIAFRKLEHALIASPAFSALGWDEARRRALAGRLRAELLGVRSPIDEDARAGAFFPVALARLSKWMDARGGHLVADAACASSMAALSIAVRELRERKRDVVLTGGVGMTVSPLGNILFSRCRALSAQGSHPFATGADGIVLGEGSAVFILRRLADAIRDGDRVHAVIRGIAGTSDGSGHSMMAPDSEGQALAIRRGLADAGVDPASVQWVECHATGTRIGDDSELDALAGAYSTAERARPLGIGSVKAQLGHTIGAAGAAAMLKVVLGLRHRTIAPTPVRGEPRADLRLSERGFELNGSAVAWPANDGPRRAGVSSFGFGGTNWHAILEEPAPEIAAGRQAGTAFLFPGHGAPYPGMGSELYESFPVFRSAIREAGETLGLPVEELAFGKDAEKNLLRTDLVQPVLLAFDVAWYRLLREFGLRADVVAGHSVGEFAAAVAAGVLDFPDALRAIRARGEIYRELQRAGRDTGKMAALHAGVGAVRALLESAGDRAVVVANVNCPSQTVISGPSAGVEKALNLARARGIDGRMLAIEVGWHSPLAGELGAERARSAFAALSPRAPRTRLLSNVDGRYFMPGEEPGPRFADNLVEQLSRPGDFVALVRKLHADGIRRFVEVGPKSILTAFVSEILEGLPHQASSANPPKVAPRAALERLAGGIHG